MNITPEEAEELLKTHSVDTSHNYRDKKANPASGLQILDAEQLKELRKRLGITEGLGGTGRRAAGTAVFEGSTPSAPTNSSKSSKGSTVKKESEADFHTWIVEYAHLKGWMVAHFRPARVMRNGKETWETPVADDGRDFPDTVLARNGKVIILEEKSRVGKLRPGQQKWLTACGGHVVRSSDRAFIEELLK